MKITFSADIEGKKGVVHRFFNEENGQSLVEYGLLISLIALVAVVAITIFGKGIKTNLYDSADSAIANLPTS